MHAMTFPDGYFDVVICGWVLGYSDDKPLAAREILRVTKPGGTVALGVAYTRRTIEELQHRTGGLPGSEAQVRNLAEMEALFQQGIAETYFRHDGEATGVEGAGIISIFRKQ
jgi:ubiquinone/menaquinone biosynthesis C-methylase UbiE